VDSGSSTNTNRHIAISPRRSVAHRKRREKTLHREDVAGFHRKKEREREREGEREGERERGRGK
jgi:hypothetical protein